MKPAPFDYLAPTTVAEAVQALAEAGEDTKPIAGGQSLVPMLALRLTRFDALVDLNRIDALRGVERAGDVRIGAMTRHCDIGTDAVVAADVPLLALVTPLIGHFQIRNRGTLGGSIAHADPAAEYPAVALALGATIEAVGPDGPRSIAAADFFTGTWMTCLEPAEVVTAVRFPVWGPGSHFAVEEVARRHGDFALAGAVCALQLSGGRVERAAVALFGVDSTPVRAASTEAALTGASLADLDFKALGHQAVEGLEPPGDIHGSSEFRRHIGAVVVARALQRAAQEATNG